MHVNLINNNDVDFTYKATFAPDKAPYTIGLVYTQNDTDGSKPSATRTDWQNIIKKLMEVIILVLLQLEFLMENNKNDVDVTTVKIN